MGELSLGLLVVLALVLAAEFVNGWTDAPNAIATVISTRGLSPGLAVIMAAVLNFVGAFFGTAVAATIGKGIVEAEVINLVTVGAAMFAIVLWSTLAWRLGLPTSESHALVSGWPGRPSPRPARTLCSGTAGRRCSSGCCSPPSWGSASAG